MISLLKGKNPVYLQKIDVEKSARTIVTQMNDDSNDEKMIVTNVITSTTGQEKFEKLFLKVVK
jgi:hypothetical protein